jgi:hypothetical protein
MPKEIVYVRESDWSALGDGAADRVRGFVADGIRLALDGPGDTLKGSAVQQSSPADATQADRGGTAPPGASAPARRTAPPPIVAPAHRRDVREVRSDFKPTPKPKASRR